MRLQAADRARARRTNIMLVSISVLYCLCWLPLNLFNLIVDICDVIDYDPFKVRSEIQKGTSMRVLDCLSKALMYKISF